eukprot:Sspe_Gene.44691::Locus_21931_Transcript_1_2_Confidence_0.500_Length_2882::g.44691::m.44691
MAVRRLAVVMQHLDREGEMIQRCFSHSAPVTIHFYFDVSSFNAYRASTKIDDLAARVGAKVVYEPFLIGGLFKALVPDVNYTVNTPRGKFTQYGPVPWMLAVKTPGKSKAKKFAQKLPAAVLRVREGIECKRPMAAGAPVVHAMRACYAAPQERRGAVCHDMMRAYHVDCSKMSLEELKGLLEKHALTRAVETPEAKEGFNQATQRAIERGVLGAPCFLVQSGNDKPLLIFGVDRMPLMEFLITGTPREKVAQLHRLRLADSKPAPGQEFTVYHDIASPWSYFALVEAEAIAQRTGAKLRLVPVDLAAIQEKTGINPGVVKATIPNKGRYLVSEVNLWARWYGLPALPQRHIEASPLDRPVKTPYTLALRAMAVEPRCAGALYKAMWESGMDLSSEDMLHKVLSSAGFDADSILATVHETGGKLLAENTAEALREGASSVPLVSHRDSEYAMHVDFTNPLGFYILEDHLSGWRIPEGGEVLPF